VIILFNNKYEVKFSYEDEEGRNIIAVLEHEEQTIIVSNAYFPNDHKAGMVFAEKMYLKILEVQSNYPNNLTICAGDFNTCMSNEDSMGRNESRNEKLLADVITGNNLVTKLKDSYRSIHPSDGYTWKRGNIYSRLDYIFVSEGFLRRVTKAETDWAFETSDHAAVKISIHIDEPIKGPGIKKINAEILKENVVEKQIGGEIEEMMEQAGKDWDPHMKLEFMKVVIRSVFSTKVAELRTKSNEEMKEIEEEINHMEVLKLNLHKNQKTTMEDKHRRLEVIEKAISTLKASLNNLKQETINRLSFASSAKWFEFGEKSNKFFLNLNKAKQCQKSINLIRNENIEYKGQEGVTEGVTKFYKELYSKQPETINDDKNFYINCPKIDENQRKFLDNELSLDDIKKALSSCKETAPGPDGIQYVVYKKYWKIMGPIIQEVWKYSLHIGKMPPSHLESVITLLPKEGKDTKEIKNWRPITLSNCDAKIITKAISMKTAKVLESIIAVSQTAYVPGRSVMDNLRANLFYKKHCKNKNEDAVLISLDVKKAFDSVSHKYIKETLTAYGFGPAFLKTFEVLYGSITSRILLNGFFSESIKIERGVKQGDALSCAIFIICIDPLLRNINKNNEIKEITIRKKNTISKLSFKASAYADDISIICKKGCIQKVFDEYERLTLKSGLELNADKTEILLLNDHNNEETFNIRYNHKTFEITTVNTIRICGIYFCADEEQEYNLNVHEKIKKLSNKIRVWTTRGLTMEGKTLIVKTFGLSQIIYNMQAYGFNQDEIMNIERIIFKFLWSTQDNHNSIDIIKRSIMKNEYSKGGMKVTDVDSLNKSLKLKQFIRAMSSSHAISNIQAHLSTDNKRIKQEYSTVNNEEKVCESAQETLNILCDYNRKRYQELSLDKVETDRILIDEVSSINIGVYLKRNNRVFM
jgi:hypothetical protein